MEELRKVATPASGGSEEFKVDGKEVVIPAPEAEPEGEPEGGGEYAGEALDAQAAGAVVEATAKVLGKALVLATKIPEADFTPDEVEALKQLWTPIMPKLSPLTAAIVGTVVIVGGKIAMVMVEKGKQSGRVVGPREETSLVG